MSPGHNEPEANALSVLTVRDGEASIRDFRFECRGETSCRAELDELLQLLERRRADIAIFLAHPSIIGSLIEELRRRGRKIPEMVIAPPTEGAEARVTVSVSLSGLSESAHPQELLARLYEALRAAQDGRWTVAAGVGEGPPAEPAESSNAEAGADEGASQGADGEDSPGPPHLDRGAPSAGPQAASGAGGQRGEGAEEPFARSAPAQDAPPAENDGGGKSDAPGNEASSRDEREESALIDELSARLERVVNQRLQQSQP